MHIVQIEEVLRLTSVSLSAEDAGRVTLVPRPMAVAAVVVAVHVVHPLEEEVSYRVVHQHDVHVAKHHVVSEAQSTTHGLEFAATDQIKIVPKMGKSVTAS